MLSHNELGNYDPVKEAFKAYDPNGTGFADPETLRSIFKVPHWSSAELQP